MNQVLIQLIYFVIYSVVFLVIGKLSFSESDSLSKFFVGERKMTKNACFSHLSEPGSPRRRFWDLRETYTTADSLSSRHRSSRGLSARVSCI